MSLFRTSLFGSFLKKPPVPKPVGNEQLVKIGQEVSSAGWAKIKGQQGNFAVLYPNGPECSSINFRQVANKKDRFEYLRPVDSSADGFTFVKNPKDTRPEPPDEFVEAPCV